MTTLEIHLPEDLAKFVAERAEAEGHGDASVYLTRMLEQLREKAVLEAKLELGLAALDRGEGRPMTPVDWERLRSRYPTEE